MSQVSTIDQPRARIKPVSGNEIINPLQPMTNALGRIFVTDQEQSRVQRARSVMGDLVDPLSDEELEVYITEFQHLIDEWLDDFECQAFEGQTLKQVLNQE